MSKKKKSGNPGGQQNSPSSNAQGNRPNNAQGNRPNNAQSNRPNNAQGNGGSKNNNGNNGSGSTATNKKRKYVRRSPSAIQPEANSNELRPVFAAYLNMARANLYSVLCHISVQCGLPVNQKEDTMSQLQVAHFAENKLPEVRQKAYTLLMRHLPVLQQMSQAFVSKAKPGKDGKPDIEEQKYVKQSDVQNVLLNIIRVVSFQRNAFTHADHYDTPEERNEEFRREAELLRPMATSFMGSKREVARIFQYSANDMYFVNQDERMERTNEVNENGKPIYREYPDWYFRLHEKGLKYIRNDEGDFQLEPDGETPITLQLTTAGLTFLLCKLLHKKYSAQLAQQTGLFRDKSQNGHSPFTKIENEIMFNIFCSHRIRLPRGRMESTTTSVALGLDMLNELQKCPQELFETFSPEDKKLFQVARKDGPIVDNPDDDINLFRRNGDRFAQLALKYIDSFNCLADRKKSPLAAPLSDIVFQVSLGKFRYKFYDRASIDTDNKDRVRVLQKEINGYGPLMKVDEMRDGKTDESGNKIAGKYSHLIRRINDDAKQLYDADTADTKPYLTDHHASYAITGDRIGLMWNDQTIHKLDASLCYLPNLPTPMQNADGKWEVEVQAIQQNIAPRAWLSIYDLPALIFLHMLGGNPAAVIKQAYKRIDNLLSDITNERLKPVFKRQLKSEDEKREQQIRDLKKNLSAIIKEKYDGLELRDIPEKLVDYLLFGNISSQDESDKKFVEWVDSQLDGDDKQKRAGIISSLDDRIKSFGKDLDIIGDKSNRLGRKGYVDIRPGSLARYLSKNIVELVVPDEEKENGGKPTGLDFAVLQSSIAAFSSNGIALKDTDLGHIIDKAVSVSKHPFLETVLDEKPKDTVELYKKYQEAKLKWLRKIREEHNYINDPFVKHYFREAYRNRIAKTVDYIAGDNGLAARYRSTLQLPDGLFTNAIRQQLSSIDNPKIQAALADKVQGHSASYLLNVWFTQVQKDKPQPFYRNQGNHFKRHYKLFDTLYPTSDGSKTYFSDSDISSKLKKGDSDKAPVRKKIDSYINQLKIRKGSRFNSVTNIKEPVFVPAKESEKKKERTKLMHQLRDLQNSERTIRRYRNEDIMLFEMAKDLILSGGIVFKNKATTDGINNFCLQDIVPPAMSSDDSRSLLEQPIDFSLTIGLCDENRTPIINSKGEQEHRTIRQDNIKLKNYGDFFAFLYDSRIGGLLAQMPADQTFERASLEDELDNYDRHRIKAFAILQAIERKILKEHPELSDENADNPEFKTKDGKAYRNSFSGLLSLCEQYLTKEGKLNDVGSGLVDIRNAFSHNRYTSADNKTIDISTMTLPDVAKLILRWLKNHNDN